MNFAVGALFALNAMFGAPTPASAAAVVPPAPQPQTTEQYVRAYFADEPVLAEIAGCESHFKQFGKDGEVIKNPHSSAVGLFQIMSSIHASVADEKLGLDIYTTEGNVAYARYLYDTQGTTPWNDSKACWGKTAAAKELAASSSLALANK